MTIRIEGRLPYTTVRLTFRGQHLELDQVILDTGSAASVFAADVLAEIGVAPEPADRLHRMRGVGGFEFVYSKQVDRLSAGELACFDFTIQVGALHYGFPIQGLLGLDFLLSTNAILDLGRLELRAGAA